MSLDKYEMKILFKKYTSSYRLLLAEIISDEDNLLSELKGDMSDNELVKFEEIKSNKRRLEWLGVRVLLKQILGDYEEILYYDSGRPYLSNNFISISHSNGIIALIVSSLPNTAIDVEAINERIVRVAPKFMTENEINYFEDLDKINYITANWSIKETIFKIYSNKNVNFKENIIVERYKIKDNGKISVIFKNSKVEQKFKIKYKIINFTEKEEQYFLSWYKGDL